MCVCVRLCVCLYIYMYICVCVCVFCIYIYIYIYMCVCVCVCVFRGCSKSFKLETERIAKRNILFVVTNYHFFENKKSLI